MMDPAATERQRQRPLVFLSAVQYGSILSGRTRRLADALSVNGREVHFVQIPSVRASATAFLRARREASQPAGVRTYSLLPLPQVVGRHSPAARRLWTRYAARELQAKIAGLRDAAVIVSSPWWAPVVRSLQPGLLCYDCIDYVGVHSGSRDLAAFQRWEDELVERSDLIVTVSSHLQNHFIAKGVEPHRLVKIANGVEGSWLAAAKEAAPESQSPSQDRKIAGFLGAIYEWIDVPLLAHVARALPEVDFWIAGPTRREVSIRLLAGLTNVKMLPAQPYALAPRLISQFDVAMIPFKRDEAARAADPIKLYEYLARGKPVVSTVDFGVAGEHIAIAPEADRFAAAIVQELKSDTLQRRQSRIDFAATRTWQARAEAMESALAAARRRTESRP